MGPTPFRAHVWEYLRVIPRGRVATYGDIARAIGRPGAARAVARACATNPQPITVPCHRVVMGDGCLGGYSGPGGAARKALLLRVEGIRVQRGRIKYFNRVRYARHHL